MINKDEIIKRRNKLIETLEEDSILVLFAGKAKHFSADEDFPFEINRNFYYLTNIKEEGSILIISKIEGQINETLFIPPFDPLVEKWTGKRISAEKASLVSGINNILYIDQFKSELESLLKSELIKNFYLDLDYELKIDDNKTTLSFKEELSKVYSKINFIDVYKDIIRLRMIKSDEEVAQFKKAVHITRLGIEELLKNVSHGKKEFQMAALFEYTIANIDNSKTSFTTISSTGENSTCLHYSNGKSELKDGNLALFDLGARHNLYCADISRTVPVNGKFNSLQRTIYQIVLECNKLVKERIKPGVTLKELNDFTIQYLASRCLEAKLIKKKEDIKDYYYHSVSHFIGLDTHDPAFSDKDKEINYREIPLKEGNIISDEPGLYFKEFGIGIRIEDDILVTKDGSYCLSEEIIKEIDEIEDFMKKYNKNL